MAITISFEMAYSQLVVFARALQQPFNDWTDRHVSQGFAWRPGSVSFRSMSESGQYSVEIVVSDHVGSVHPEAVRAVEVPFEVPADGAIEIGSILKTIPLSLPVGSYLLRCEFLQPADAEGSRVRLTFGKMDIPHFAIVCADPELSLEGDLLTMAQPAIC